MTATVIVTDGNERAALATVRALGRAGHSVDVCAATPQSIAGSSRYCRQQWAVADPLRDPHQFASDLLRVVETTGANVLIPVSEASLLAILPARDRFPCSIPFASADAFSRICDKQEVLACAVRSGIAVPSQFILNSADASPIPGSFFPVALKPARSVSGADDHLFRTGVTYASNSQEAAEKLRRLPEGTFPVLAQQLIEGPGFGISVLVWKGNLRAAFAHQRIREKPPSGGVSVLRKSIPLDEDLLLRSLDLLRQFDWEGVAMVEFKLDERSGVPYLMEINGRLWGSLQLAIDAGVDFPNLLVSLARGEDPGPGTQYSTGVRSRWEWGDVDHLVASLLHPKRVALPSTGSSSGRLRSATDFLRSFVSRDVPEVFRRDDPRPFLRETINWFRGG